MDDLDDYFKKGIRIEDLEQVIRDYDPGFIKKEEEIFTAPDDTKLERLDTYLKVFCYSLFNEDIKIATIKSPYEDVYTDTIILTAKAYTNLEDEYYFKGGVELLGAASYIHSQSEKIRKEVAAVFRIQTDLGHLYEKINFAARDLPKEDIDTKLANLTNAYQTFKMQSNSQFGDVVKIIL